MHQNVLVSKPQTSMSPAKPGTTSLSRKDRLFRVQLGVAAGKSNRQIAKELCVDEGTVRRDRRTLQLSKEDLQAVKSGAAVEPLLRTQERRKAATAREKQEAAERESQYLTDRLVNLISTWLNQYGLIPPNQLHIIMGIDRWSWEYRSTNPHFVSDSKIKATIEGARPKADDDLELFALIEFLKVWLFRWVVLIEPDRDIRDRALRKIRQELERQTPAW